MEAVRQAHVGTADFAKVYVSEVRGLLLLLVRVLPLTPRPPLPQAHPIDEWKVYSDIDYCQPKTMAARAEAARKMLTAVPEIQATMVLDTLCNAAEELYSAHPERHYIVERATGKIVYKGGMVRLRLPVPAP